MIFAAGFGTRMGTLTANQPKPLIEVAGKPLVDHALDIANSAGIETIVANLHYLPEALAEHLAPKGVKMSLEADQILETGGGLRQARQLLRSNPTYTINSDVVWTGANPLTQLKAAWNPDEMDALLLLIDPKNARGHAGTGDFSRDDNGRLTRKGPLIYTGAQIIKTDLLDDIEEEVFSLNRLWDVMMTRSRLFGTLHQGGWCDVGHPEGIAQAHDLLNYSRDV